MQLASGNMYAYYYIFTFNKKKSTMVDFVDGG